MESKATDPSTQPPAKDSGVENATAAAAASGQDNTQYAKAVSGVFLSFTKGLVNTSQSAVKAVQVKARHLVSQNKRRYQEGGFDLDLTYITENIIAMGFPAGDISSGLFGYVEGFYRNHMEEVISFLETTHKGKYKVYNLCSERLYDASRFEGKAASFPFDDHNCPPIELIESFCRSAHSWLKEGIENVVVVHCKAGMARTGVMICSLLLFLKFFPTAEEAMNYYNHKRCIDGKALVLPSQIRYVKYFEHILKHFNGETPPARRNFVLIKEASKNERSNEDFWINARKKGFVVFALPGEPGLAELVGDFKIQFQDSHGDFYCWLNTMTENRKVLTADDLDGYEKRKLPCPGFQVEVVMIDYDGATLPTKAKADSSGRTPEGSASDANASSHGVAGNPNQSKISQREDGDDVFSDSDGDETEDKMSRQAEANSRAGLPASNHPSNTRRVDSPRSNSRKPTNDGAEKSHPGHSRKLSSSGGDDIRAMAADASVFSFGDDFDSE
ncbi:hypothetical protein DVH24_026258 [Malus domestica]|uniref:Phosphatidylinositol-3,4,5-trisphosphate 3-phosphatase n=1 Tax=Malus domestica TaxID=3750 RepID=A0A498KN48_MALDO|nr:hypothetical protein DVH24_026258 [Malus domestica]